MISLKLVTLNIEGNKHWEEIVPFIERENPDVLCLQELFERHAEMLGKRFGYTVETLPIARRPYKSNDPDSSDWWGIGIATKLAFSGVRKEYYYEDGKEIKEFVAGNPRGTDHQGIVWGEIVKEGVSFTIGTTKFTWTPDGLPNHSQDEDIVSLLKLLEAVPELVLCGDFNVPRAKDNRIYAKLAERFKDAIPASIETTVDLENHYAAKDPVIRAKLATFVVDYIFSTPAYAVSEVRTESGVSDHLAVIATVSKI